MLSGYDKLGLVMAKYGQKKRNIIILRSVLTMGVLMVRLRHANSIRMCMGFPFFDGEPYFFSSKRII